MYIVKKALINIKRHIGRNVWIGLIVLAIARALAYDSKTILGDEPTGNLDKETETEILDIFTNLAHEDNKCVIIISHSSSVKEKVDVVLNLKEGHVVNSSRKS